MAKDKENSRPTIKKKEYSLKDYKAQKGLNDDVKDKNLQWIPLSEAFQEVSGLPGIPKGYVSLSRGFSNTGKSTSLLEAFASCQKLGILPIFIDTENSFDWSHAKTMGVTYNEIADEHGEVVGYDGFFIYVNNEYLINNFGKKRDKNRQEAVIEDVAEFVHHMIDEQTKGSLPYELCFLWDSIGTLDCEQCITSKSRNNMWNAGALETSFKSIINHRIPSSRKENKEYTNTFLAVQKIWIDSMQGAGVIKHKGGEAFFYAARLIFHYGGVQSHGTKRLTAVSDKRDYSYAIQTKFEIVKNQVNGISYKGEIISTPHGFITVAGIDEYKKDHKDYLLSKLGISDGEIEYTEEDGKDDFGVDTIN